MKRVFSGCAVLLFSALAATATSGCSACDTQGQEPIQFEGGRLDPTGTVYETTTLDEDLLHFPPGRVYDLVHGLGVRPVSVNGYISLARRLTDDGDPYDSARPNNLTESAGNQMVIERWDERVVRIRNDTCADFYVRVVAFAPEAGASFDPGLGGASSE